MNSKSLVVCLIAFGLLIISLMTLNGDIAWMALPFLAYLGLGILQTPTAEKVRLHVRRNLTQTRTGETASIDVNLTVRNESAEEIQCLISDTGQTGMNVTDGKLSEWAGLRAGESTELKYTF